MTRTAAVIGAGTIGLSWATLFSAHGMDVRVNDPRPDLEETVRETVTQFAASLSADPTELLSRISVEPDLEAAVGGALVAVTTTELPDDWSERWKQFHVPLVLGDRLAVRPPWEAPIGTDVEIGCSLNAGVLREDVAAVEIRGADGADIAVAEVPAVDA